MDADPKCKGERFESEPSRSLSSLDHDDLRRSVLAGCTHRMRGRTHIRAGWPRMDVEYRIMDRGRAVGDGAMCGKDRHPEMVASPGPDRPGVDISGARAFWRSSLDQSRPRPSEQRRIAACAHDRGPRRPESEPESAPHCCLFGLGDTHFPTRRVSGDRSGRGFWRGDAGVTPDGSQASRDCDRLGRYGDGFVVPPGPSRAGSRSRGHHPTCGKSVHSRCRSGGAGPGWSDRHSPGRRPSVPTGPPVGMLWPDLLPCPECTRPILWAFSGAPRRDGCQLHSWGLAWSWSPHGHPRAPRSVIKTGVRRLRPETRSPPASRARAPT